LYKQYLFFFFNLNRNLKNNIDKKTFSLCFNHLDLMSINLQYN
jgi:hypothetical protein